MEKVKKEILVDINVIITPEYTNYFLIKSVKNIAKVVKYTEENSSIKIKKINFIVNSKEKAKYQYLDKVKDVLSNWCIVEHSFINVSDMFNDLKTYNNSDYVALYSANTMWSEDHLITSVNSLKCSKNSWSLGCLTLRNSISARIYQTKMVMVKHDRSMPFMNDICWGEILIKNNVLKDIDFNKGVLKDGNIEDFFIGYALKCNVGEYEQLQHSTVYYYTENENYEDDDITLVKYKAFKKVKEEDRNKILFSILVNCSYLISKQDIDEAIDSLDKLDFPKENYEIIFLTNYNSLFLFYDENELKKKFPNCKVTAVTNQLSDISGNIQEFIFKIGSDMAVGKYITYLDLNEHFLYNPEYLSCLYDNYEIDANCSYLVSNFISMLPLTTKDGEYIKSLPVHSNITRMNIENVYFSNVSHKKLEVVYSDISLIHKYFNKVNLMISNIISILVNKQLTGTIIPFPILTKRGYK